MYENVQLLSILTANTCPVRYQRKKKHRPDHRAVFFNRVLPVASKCSAAGEHKISTATQFATGLAPCKL